MRLCPEGALRSILAERRRGIHRAFAQAIEILFENRLEDFTILLAYHYTRAEDWEKAQAYLFKAGDQAGRMAARRRGPPSLPSGGSRLLESLRRTGLSPLQRTSLARKIGAALYGAGHYEQEQDSFDAPCCQAGLSLSHLALGVRGATLEISRRPLCPRLRSRAGIPTAKRALDLELAKEISTICHHMSG